MTRVLAKRMGDLSPSLYAEWRALSEDPECSGGPFLHPAYARVVSGVRPGVEVAIVSEDEAAVGFVPYERSALGIGRSLGSKLCDRSGAIVRPGVRWDVAEVTRAAGLRMLRLVNVPTTSSAFRPYVGRGVASPFINLSGGFESYRRATVSSGSSMFKRLERQARRLEEDLGLVRFEWHDPSDAAFAELLRWKAARRRATRTPNVLGLPWARALLERLRAMESDGVGAVLSTLYAGETLCAAHFGIRTHRVLHYWIPAYDETLGRHSPGMLLLMEIARAAAERGIERVELGPGEEAYKLRASTGSREVATATSCSDAAMSVLVGAADRVRAWSRRSRAGEMLRAAGRTLTRGSYLAQSTVGDSRDGS